MAVETTSRVWPIAWQGQPDQGGITVGNWPVDDRKQLHDAANKAIDRELAPGEIVKVIIRGIQSSAIIGTDRRAFVFKKNLFDVHFHSWEYGAISGVEYNDKGPMMPGFVRIKAIDANSKGLAHQSDNALQVSFQEKGDAQRSTAVLRRLVSEYASPSAAAAAPTPVVASVADEIRKLAALRDEGLVTDDEFESRKQQLLGS